MLFRRLVMNAVIVGVLAGLLLSVMQVLAVNPISFAAEDFEQANAVEASDDQDRIVAADDHHHSHDGWAPEDGTERLFFSFVANVMAGIGFAVMVLALMSQLQLQGIASGLSNFVFWLAIGAISAWILNRWVLSDRSATVGEIR